LCEQLTNVYFTYIKCKDSEFNSIEYKYKVLMYLQWTFQGKDGLGAFFDSYFNNWFKRLKVWINYEGGLNEIPPCISGKNDLKCATF